MAQQQDIHQDIQSRFFDLLFGINKEDETETNAEAGINPEQTDDGRTLLRVEKIAQRDKNLNEKSYQSFVDSIDEQLHDAILERIDEQLEAEAFEDLYSNIIGIHENLPDVLDMLSVRAASIGRIEPLVSSIPWLHSDILKTVNMPKYRRTDKNGKVIAVENIKVALGYFGIDNLKLLIPSLAFRRWIPQITDPYPLFKTHIWEHAIGSALSCKVIAQVSELDEGHAFTLGMLHELGQIALVRMYFKQFDTVQREALEEAHKERQREEHDALLKITPSIEFLQKLLDERAFALSTRIIQHMDMRRVFIANAMDEFAQDMSLAEMSPMAKVLKQGQAYNQYRMLKANQMINMDEAKAFLRLFQMPPGALAVLKTTNLRNLNLTFEEE